jgi:hypothetical protein
MIEAGMVISTLHGESLVMVIEYHNGTGLVPHAVGSMMVYTQERDSYSVWTVSQNNTFLYPTERGSVEEALNAFAVRCMERLYGHFNLLAPSLTFDRLPDDHKLKG